MTDTDQPTPALDAPDMHLQNCAAGGRTVGTRSRQRPDNPEGSAMIVTPIGFAGGAYWPVRGNAVAAV